MASVTVSERARAGSLEDIHSSVPIPRTWWRRFLAFSGPAFLVSVGYMDPGNWGTDLEAGSKFGYTLLWVLLMSNAMAVLLQSLATRLGVVSGRDLAQACRENYPRPTVLALWGLCEVAIAACDLAEVIGTVIALNLLFNLPYWGGLIVAAADTFLLLALQRRGVRLVELVTLGLIAVIAGSFCVEIFLAKPEWGEVVRGFVPGFDPNNRRESMYIAIAMLGATVMPHNLYLHSALVQTRAFPQSSDGKRLACKYNFFDSLLALNGAFFVNAAILILAVSTFHVRGQEPETLGAAKGLLTQVWGPAAGILFAVALLASGQSSTLTGTLAGQVVMEGFLRLRLRPWVRRLLTRSLAILPALLVISLAGNESLWGTASVDENLLGLLVLSQVVLSFQLPFAIVPLVQCTSDPRRMGEFASRGWLKALAWACAGVVVALNVVYLYLQSDKWVTKDGANPLLVYGTVAPVGVVLLGFLGWVTIYPLWRRPQERRGPSLVPPLPGVRYQTIGVAVELEGSDDAVLVQAAALARAHGAKLIPVHIVESAGAEVHGAETDDHESRSDRQRLTDLVEHLQRDGLQAQGVLGFGKPAEELVGVAEERQFDLLVLGAHGHRLLADLALGATVSPVLHRLKIPVLVVPNRPRGG